MLSYFCYGGPESDVAPRGWPGLIAPSILITIPADVFGRRCVRMMSDDILV